MLQTQIARGDAKFEEKITIFLYDPTKAIHKPAVLVPAQKKAAGASPSTDSLKFRLTGRPGLAKHVARGRIVGHMSGLSDVT